MRFRSNAKDAFPSPLEEPDQIASTAVKDDHDSSDDASSSDMDSDASGVSISLLFFML